MWEYEIKKTKKYSNNKTLITQIFKGPPSELTLTFILETYSNWKDSEESKNYPVFYVRCEHNFPMEQTFIPILKRKITAHIFQILNLEKISSFDS